MALVHAYKHSALQAEAASRYFLGLANEWAGEALRTMLPAQLILQEPGSPALNIRLWTFPGGRMQVRGMLGWIRQVHRQMEALARPGEKPMAHLPNLLNCPEPEASCYIELLGRACFTPDEEHLLNIGLRQGRTILLSSPKVMLVQLEEELVGLAVHGRGSWLVEGRTAPVEQPQGAGT